MKRLLLWAPLLLAMATSPTSLRAEGLEGLRSTDAFGPKRSDSEGATGAPEATAQMESSTTLAFVASPRANPIATPAPLAQPNADQVLEQLRARASVKTGAPLGLERPIYFTGDDGALTRLAAGLYGLTREGPAIRIRPADGGDGLLLRATSMNHDLSIGGPIALSVPGRGDRAGVHLVTLLMPGGEALTAVGTQSGVVERGFGSWLKSAGNTIVAGGTSLGNTVASGAESAGSAIASGAETAGKAVVSGATTVGKTVAGGAEAAAETVVDVGVWIGEAAVTSYDAAERAVEHYGKNLEDKFAAYKRCVNDPSASALDCAKAAAETALAASIAWNVAVEGARWLSEQAGDLVKLLLCKAMIGLVEGAAWIQEVSGPLQEVIDTLMTPVKYTVNTAMEASGMTALMKSGEEKLFAQLASDPARFQRIYDVLSIISSEQSRFEAAKKFITSPEVCECTASELKQKLQDILGPAFAAAPANGSAAPGETPGAAVSGTVAETPAATQPAGEVQDGGFELGLTSTARASTPLASFGRWTVIGDAGGVVLLGLPYGGIPVRDRGREALHIGNNKKAGGVKQSFRTEAGREYRVTLWAVNWQGMGTGSGSIRLNGGALLNQSFSASATPGWTLADYRFTATGAVTTLEIQNRSGSALTIDDVEITPAPAREPAVVAAPTPTPQSPPSASPSPTLTVENIVGEYGQDPVQNAWGVGRIEKDASGQLRWTNDAGVSWTLTPDLANNRLITGPDNPYHNYQGGVAVHREFKLIVRDNQIAGFLFSNGTYHRKAAGQVAMTASSVVGDYRADPVLNQWRIGSIVQQGGKLLWKNKAGVSWTLTPDLANQRLTTGPDNPYYNYQGGAAAHREFKLIVRNNQVAGFTFSGSTYLREDASDAGRVVSRGVAPAGLPTSQASEPAGGAARRAEWIPSSRVATRGDKGTRDQAWAPSEGQGQRNLQGSSSAQTFTAGKAGLLRTVALKIERSAWANSDLTVEIRRTDKGGRPTRDGPLYAEAYPSTVFPLTSSDVWTELDVRSAGIHVKPGDRLAVAIRSANPVSYDWAHADGYAAGQGFVEQLGEWMDGASDFAFLTDVDGSIPAVATRGALLSTSIPGGGGQDRQPGPYGLSVGAGLYQREIGALMASISVQLAVSFPTDVEATVMLAGKLEALDKVDRFKAWGVSISCPFTGNTNPFADDDVPLNYVVTVSLSRLSQMLETFMEKQTAEARIELRRTGFVPLMELVSQLVLLTKGKVDISFSLILGHGENLVEGFSINVTPLKKGQTLPTGTGFSVEVDAKMFEVKGPSLH